MNYPFRYVMDNWYSKIKPNNVYIIYYQDHLGLLAYADNKDDDFNKSIYDKSQKV